MRPLPGERIPALRKVIPRPCRRAGFFVGADSPVAAQRRCAHKNINRVVQKLQFLNNNRLKTAETVNFVTKSTVSERPVQ
jgi:hypothetical protein